MSEYTIELNLLLNANYDFDLKSYPIFDEAYRDILNNKILEHYRFREIGLETPALFKFYLNRKLNEIMPYYNQLYKSQLLVFNPLYSTDYTDTTTKNTTATNTTDNTLNNTNIESHNKTLDLTNTETHGGSTTDSSSTNLKDVVSDTPQGLLSMGDISNNVYASKAEFKNETVANTHDDNLTITDKNTGTDNLAINGTNTGTQHSVNSFTNTDDYTRHIVGNTGSKNYSQLLQGFRSTFLNIDMLIINELSQLFINVW